MCHSSWSHRRQRGDSDSSESFEGRRGRRWARFFMRGGHGHGGPGGEDSGGLGVRRPLRFLAYKLGLDEKQVEDLARILAELKTERAQAAVDDRRSQSELADAVVGETFNSATAVGAGDRRVASAARLKDAVAKALEQIHALLNAEQRGRLAYLIRTGVLGL